MTCQGTEHQSFAAERLTADCIRRQERVEAQILNAPCSMISPCWSLHRRWMPPAAACAHRSKMSRAAAVGRTANTGIGCGQRSAYGYGALCAAHLLHCMCGGGGTLKASGAGVQCTARCGGLAVRSLGCSLPQSHALPCWAARQRVHDALARRRPTLAQACRCI